MSYFITIFCRAATPLTTAEVIQFVTEGVYFVPASTFEYPRDNEHLTWLTIHYQPRKRPVQIQRDVDPIFVHQQIEEVITFDLPPANAEVNNIVAHLHATQQTIGIELDPVGILEDAWLMLDGLKAFLAGNLDGIIYAPDDGFFDAQLQRLLDLRQ